MNPFMMQMMMNPMMMGMGFMPYSCCNMTYSRPYQHDLSFFNFPIVRDTSMDWILNPNIALAQCQQQWQSGNFGFGGFGGFGGIGGGFTFPGFTGLGLPGIGQTHTETEEEKKKREAKETEAKKPDAKKAASLKKVFDSVTKLAENKKNRFPKIPEELVKKAEEALKKDTAAEQLKAMKEVMASIPDNVLRKTILADEDIKKQLREAGYNFNIETNKYSLKDDDINETDIAHEKRITAIRSDIENCTYNYTEFQNLSSQVNGNNAAPNILRFVSAWNSKNNEKFFDLVAEHIPEGNDVVKLKSLQDCVTTIAKALVIKADEYEGYPEITRLKKVLAEKISAVDSSASATIEERKAAYKKENIKALSNAFNELYVRLRMQEAVKVRDAIKEHDDFKVLNELKEGLINDDMIVEETIKDLEEEGITNYPKVDELDKPPVTEDIVISVETDAEDADERYKGNPQGLIDEYLDEEEHVLTKIKNTNVYQTIAYDKDGNGVRYFTVKDDKLIEVRKTADGKYTATPNAPAVTAKEICAYDLTLKRLNNLLDPNTKVLEPYKGNFTTTKLPFPVFKATGANEFYALIDGKLGKIDKCTELTEDKTNKKIHAKGTEKTLDQLTADDLADFKDEDVKSQTKVENDKKAEEEKDVSEVAKKTYSSFDKIDNEALAELSKITGKEDDFEETAVKGYFHCKSTDRYYVYNQTTGKLDYLKGVTKISDTGYMIKDNQWLPCTELINVKNAVSGSEELQNAIQDYAKAFAKDLNGVTSEKEDVDAKRRLNTFTSFTDPEYIVNFIKGYKAYKGFWSNKGMCKQIATENGLKEGTTHTDKESKRYYIKWIAIRMKEVFNKTSLSKNSDEYKLLEQISRGELLSEISSQTTGVTGAVVRTNEFKSVKATAETLDKIIDKVIEAYDEKISN